MTENPALHILRICLALVAAPWALAIAAFILIACTIAQMLALSTSVTVFTITRRWAPAANIIRDVALPRIAEMWRDWSALWLSGNARHA
jgi:hypothetical protein